MGVPYENPPVLTTIDDLDSVADVGDAIDVAMDYPSRSIISAIKVIQATGTPGTFDVEIFNRDPNNLPAGIPLKSFYLCNKKSANADGELLYFSDEETGGHGFTFYSQDAPAAGRIQGNVRTIYVRITGTGLESKTFSVILASEIQVGGE